MHAERDRLTAGIRRGWSARPSPLPEIAEADRNWSEIGASNR
jgi:hypothetical protein